MNSELIKRIVKSFQTRDNEAFVSAVTKLVHSERRQGHRRLADDLEKIINNGLSQRQGNERTAAKMERAPRSKSEGASIIDIRRSSRTLNDIVLEPECEKRLSRFLEEFSKRSLLAEHGLAPKRKLLFFGPPGNGKTMCAEVIAGELDLPLFYVRFDALVASYLGETAANLRQVFEYAAKGLGVLFFDEVDAIAKSRDDRNDVGELKRVVNSFLQLLDGYSGESPVIAATNHEDVLDYAIWRRFDDLLFFPAPTPEGLMRILSIRLSGFKLKGFEITETAKWCEGMSFSDVSRVVTEAIKTMVLSRAPAITASMMRQAVEQHRLAATHRPGNQVPEPGDR